ncbi:MAG: ankyrin repeat domain-containing protein [Maritimibacter sp.]
MGQSGKTPVAGLIAKILKGGLRLVFFAVGAVVLAAIAFIGPKVWRLTNPPLASNLFWIGGGYHESEAGRAERLQRLEKRLARTSPNKTTEAGRSAMHFGAAWGDAAAMAALVGAGGDVNAQSAQGETPLMEAAGTGNLETFEALLVAGADLNAADAAGRSVLVHAINHAARGMMVLQMTRSKLRGG